MCSARKLGGLWWGVQKVEVEEDIEKINEDVNKLNEEIKEMQKK